MQNKTAIRPTLRDILFTLFRYRWAALGTFSVILAGGILLTARTPRVFEAKTRVFIGTDARQVHLNQMDQIMRVTLEELITTEVEFVKSLPVIEQAIALSGVDNSGRRTAIDQVMSNLRVLPVRNTSLMELRLEYGDRLYSMKLLDNIVATYLSRRKNLDQKVDDQPRYENLLTDINTRMSKTEAELNEFSMVHNITGVNAQQQQRELDQLVVLENSRVDLEGQLLSLREEVRTLDSLHKNFFPEGIPATLPEQNRQLRGWMDEYLRLSQEQLKESGLLTPNAPALLQIETRLTALRGRMKDQITQTAISSRRRLAVLESNHALVLKEIAQLKSRGRELASSSSKHSDLQLQLEDLRSVRTVLTRQLEENRIHATDAGTQRVEQLEPSTCSESPVKPNILFNLVSSLVLALAFGISLPFYLQAVNGTLFHDYEVQRATDIKVLCSVRNF